MQKLQRNGYRELGQDAVTIMRSTGNKYDAMAQTTSDSERERRREGREGKREGELRDPLVRHGMTAATRDDTHVYELQWRRDDS